MRLRNIRMKSWSFLGDDAGGGEKYLEVTAFIEANKRNSRRLFGNAEVIDL